jgi:hypothetical protein
MPATIIRIVGSFFTMIFGVYFAITSIFFLPYYNWQYAREHGFIEWLFFGEIISSTKAFAWPYYVFSNYYISSKLVLTSQKIWSSQDIANSKHFLFSIQADLQSKKLSHDRASTGVTNSERNEILLLKQTALREVRLTNDATLRKIHPDLPHHLATEYIPALEKLIQSLTSPNDDPEAAQEGVKLFDAWVDWWNENKESIYIPE